MSPESDAPRALLNRAALGAVSTLALVGSAAWWLATGLLAGDHSACGGDPEAWAAYAFSYAGLVLALAGLGLALANERLRIGWIALALYGLLLGASVVVFFTCEDDLTKEIDGELGGGRVTDVSSLRDCLDDAGARLARSRRDLRFRTGVMEIYEGKLPNRSDVLLVEGLNHRFHLYFAMKPGMASPGINGVFKDPSSVPVAAYIHPDDEEVAEAANECLPRMRTLD